MNSSYILSSLFLGIGLTFSLPASALEYNLFDLGSVAGHEKTYAMGINASGQVVGYGYSNGNWGWSSTDDYQAFVTDANGLNIRTLGTLGGSWSKGQGINDAGQVVGVSSTADSSPRAFIGDSGHLPLRNLGTLGGTSSSATAINASGQVVGSASNPSGASRAFITAANGKSMRDLGVNGTASGINNSGQVVGSKTIDDYRSLAFVSGPNGTPLGDISIKGFVDGSSASAINDRGQIAGAFGAYVGDGGAFLTGSDGVGIRLDFGTAGNFDGQGFYTTFNSSSLAVNAGGQVAGSFAFSRNMDDHAFITGKNGSNVTDVNMLTFSNGRSTLGLGDIFRTATGINDSGQFVANASNGHAYLISPVPEASTVSMLLAGLGLLGGLSRRQSARGGRSFS